jgi:hypothetical protein
MEMISFINNHHPTLKILKKNETISKKSKSKLSLSSFNNKISKTRNKRKIKENFLFKRKTFTTENLFERKKM